MFDIIKAKKYSEKYADDFLADMLIECIAEIERLEDKLDEAYTELCDEKDQNMVINVLCQNRNTFNTLSKVREKNVGSRGAH